MKIKWYKVWQWSCLLLLSGSLMWACGGSTDECQSNGDCTKAKGDGYVCSTQGDGKKCVKKDTSACSPACKSTEKCVANKCVQCEADTDCSVNQTCNNGVCTLKADCNPACATGEKCVNSKCVQCSADTDCSSTQMCDATGKCVPKTTGCNPACAIGQKCVNNQCVQCAANTDCAATEQCDSTGKCVPKTTTGCNPPCATNEKCVANKCIQCSSNNDCAATEICDANGKCVPKTTGCNPPCAANETCDSSGKCVPNSTGCNPPCATGQKCVNSRCVQCSGDADCASTEQCDAAGKCVPKTTTGCNPPCIAGQKCVNSKCVQCAGDTDCASTETCDATGKCVPKTTGCNPPCASNQKCVANKCVQCAGDTDCASTETCDSTGTCVPKTTGCNPPCASNQKCVANKCVQCATNTDCQSGFTCTNGQCVQQKTCVSDTDCSAGEVCANQVCRSPVGTSCSATQTCPTGFICLNAGNNQLYCFQDCSSNASACAQNTSDGRTQCLAVGTDQSTGQPISICLKLAKKGEACAGATWTTTGQALCDTSGTPGLYCSSKNTCDEYQVRKNTGDTCNKANDTTEPRYICDNASKLVCLESTGKCALADVAKEGEPCDLQGTVLGKSTICDPTVTDLICIRFDQNGALARCHKLCDPQKAGQCSHNANLTCWGVLSGGGGLCYDVTCTQDSDCAFSNYACITSPISSQSGKVCWPNAPVGPKTFGQACGEPIATNGCQKSFLCLLTNDDNGYCSTDCTNATCGTAKDAAGNTLTSKCETFGSTGQTFKRCVFSCGGTGQTCPTDLTNCQDVTNSAGSPIKICAPPIPVGPKALGELCTLPTATNGCKKDLFCLRATSNNNGYCSRDCTTDNTCGTVKDSAGNTFTLACTGGLLSGTQKICILPCGQPGQTCPTGTQCTPIGTTSICLAP